MLFRPIRILAVIGWLTLGAPLLAADAVELLPADVDYAASVPTPESILGQPIGRWHLRPDQLVAYFEALAAESDRMVLEVQGTTHEGRPQILAIVTAPENHARLEEIRRRHLELSDPSLPAPTPEELESLPVVVYLGYSIHGNEASGSNAAPLVAYHLTAATGGEIETLLADAVVLIDPSLNPDGMGRFASWANMHRGRVAVADPNHREHQEGWPSGRTNHYWFDLNRDWLLLQHPESRARVRTFHRWQPNLVGDYHETWRNSNYFFQPGVSTREHPLKPERNLELTRALAGFHARFLEADGQLFYSEETFDDFYPGKGSTYPDLNGAVGVLFEQPSARGHVQETVNGTLEFSRAIRNQFLTSLSMLAGAKAHRVDLLQYQTDFPRRSLRTALGDPVAAYVFSCGDDVARCARMMDIFRQHRIDVHRIADGIEIDGRAFDPAVSWAVPMDQPQYLLAKALLERRTTFEDSIFYDVSSWTLPLAFGADVAEVSRGLVDSGLVGARVSEPIRTSVSFDPRADSYAYAFDWDGYFAPRALRRLLDAGLRPRVATRGFQAETAEGPREFGFGTIVVPVAGHESDADLGELFESIARDDGLRVWSLGSGLTPSGVDLGSPSILPLRPVRPLLVVGRGVSTYEAGEVWHLLDQRFGIELSLVDLDRLGEIDLDDYTHVLAVGGTYAALSEEVEEAIRGWVEGGGVLVASKSAASWAEDALLGLAESEEESPADPDETTAPVDAAGRVYEEYERDRAVELVSGAIFEVELDVSHPIAFGYRSDRLAVFRNSTAVLRPSTNPYEVVARYTDAPLLSGYASPANVDEAAGAAAVLATRLGEGTVIVMADNPNFRGFWYGTSKLYLNSIFFGSIVKQTSSPADW